MKSTLTIEPVSPFVKRNFLLAQATHGSNKSYVRCNAASLRYSVDAEKHKYSEKSIKGYNRLGYNREEHMAIAGLKQVTY